jgi:predicted house-cleaning noncanonical NTP pyrophosphatase (MazG superfamily)
MPINKLVQDKIPDIIKDDDKTSETHEADTEELWKN